MPAKFRAPQAMLRPSPLREYRTTKRKLSKILEEMLLAPAADRCAKDVAVEGNEIGILLYADGEIVSKKVSAVVHPKGTQSDVLQTITGMLERAILAKSKSCSQLFERGPVWLALLSDGF